MPEKKRKKGTTKATRRVAKGSKKRTTKKSAKKRSPASKKRSSVGSHRVAKLPTRTKIVATLGPASATLGMVRKLIRAGVDVFRLNFSHSDHNGHSALIRLVRRASRMEQRAVAILADLQGPKIRVGSFEKKDPFFLKRGDPLVIVAEEGVKGVPGRVSCTYMNLPQDTKPGERILLDDGAIELKVKKIVGNEVHCVVRFGGLLFQHKGINLPGTKVQAPTLSEKDLFDLHFALTQRVDFIALSFVREAADVLLLREEIQSFGGDAQIIAKIERPEAVKNAQAIVEAADAIMVARGDMGVELGPEAVPAIQKRLIRLAVGSGKPVITATQMLESMIHNPRPTRAEASDIANAIYDGSSAVMLSGESANGKYPVLAVKTMERIARKTESDLFSEGRPYGGASWGGGLQGRREALAVSSATVSAAAEAAIEAKATAIVVFTETGTTAGLVSRERLPIRCIAFTPNPRTYQKLFLRWGIIPELAIKARSVDQLLRYAETQLLAKRHVKPGDRVVFVAGTVQVTGATNTFSIRVLGEG